ncbi:protein-L-isoaspartate(D-aspartate) O-methyltransferase [bacterium]|nr:protein-L-isoaspartate(D-aspartate) O-methyltransferase [bacterium]
MQDNARREKMVKEQIAGRGISDPRVLATMRSVPRHRFLPPEAQAVAYDDSPIRIGEGQTISQPYIVALMTELLNVGVEDKVLDVGTGSGYQAAILGQLAEEVHSIERFPSLAETATKRLADLGYENIHVHTGDGSLGYPPHAPYDRIIVGAAAPSVPPALKAQLADRGRLVIPVGSRRSQHLEVWDREGDDLRRTDNISVVFVPLIGEEGWGVE